MHYHLRTFAMACVVTLLFWVVYYYNLVTLAIVDVSVSSSSSPPGISVSPSSSSWSQAFVAQPAALILPPDNFASPRGIIALYLTHIGFHGVGLLTRNLHSWTQNLIVPQKNLDLAIFFNADNISQSDLVSRLKLHEIKHETLKHILFSPAAVGASGVADIDSDSKNSSSDDRAAATASDLRSLVRSHNALLSLSSRDQFDSLIAPYHTFYRFCSSHRACILVSLSPVETRWPAYLRDAQRRQQLFARRDWLRCGCPPYCPVRRNPPEYVQGTRWYTHDMFFEAGGFVKRFYSHWVKLDVDITIFRPLPKSVNLLETMRESGDKVFLHTGYTYNGGGCSNNLHAAITKWCQLNQTDRDVPLVPVSANQSWWKQDDWVYYSNFVISKVAFHTAEKPLALVRHLNEEVEAGFFKYRWTDQSLFHKVFGVFLGPSETDFLLDFSSLRCSKKAGYHKGAIFYHSKKEKRRSELSKCTDV